MPPYVRVSELGGVCSGLRDLGDEIKFETRRLAFAALPVVGETIGSEEVALGLGRRDLLNPGR
jgi:hypothetical protein